MPGRHHATGDFALVLCLTGQEPGAASTLSREARETLAVYIEEPDPPAAAAADLCDFAPVFAAALPGSALGVAELTHSDSRLRIAPGRDPAPRTHGSGHQARAPPLA